MVAASGTAADPRAVRTQRMLVEAFNALLHEKGFPAMTVQEIAARAAVNRATFYAHFDDKYALFAYATRVSFMELVQQRLQADAPYSERQLQQLIGVLCAFLAELNQRCMTSFRAFEPMIATEVLSGIELTLGRWVAAQRGPAEQQPTGVELTTHIASWGMYGVVRSWILNRCPEPAERFIERVVPLIAPIVGQAMAEARAPQRQA